MTMAIVLFRKTRPITLTRIKTQITLVFENFILVPQIYTILALIVKVGSSIIKCNEIMYNASLKEIVKTLLGINEKLLNLHEIYFLSLFYRF